MEKIVGSSGALRGAGATHTFMGLMEHMLGSIQKRKTNTLVMCAVDGISSVTVLEPFDLFDYRKEGVRMGQPGLLAGALRSAIYTRSLAWLYSQTIYFDKRVKQQ